MVRSVLPWWAVLNKIGIGWVAPLAFLLCALFVAALLFVPRRYAIALPLIVLVYWAVAFKPIWFGPYPYGVKRAGVGALFQGILLDQIFHADSVRTREQDKKAAGRGRTLAWCC